jgi:hypothetical protein
MAEITGGQMKRNPREIDPKTKPRGLTRGQRRGTKVPPLHDRVLIEHSYLKNVGLVLPEQRDIVGLEEPG